VLDREIEATGVTLEVAVGVILEVAVGVTEGVGEGEGRGPQFPVKHT
jgi:hypothetical protein